MDGVSYKHCYFRTLENFEKLHIKLIMKDAFCGLKTFLLPEVNETMPQGVMRGMIEERSSDSCVATAGEGTSEKILQLRWETNLNDGGPPDVLTVELQELLGPVARRMVSSNQWLRSMKTYTFPW